MRVLILWDRQAAGHRKDATQRGEAPRQSLLFQRSTHTKQAVEMIYDMNAPAKAVKGRASSRKKVSYFEPSAFDPVRNPVAAARQTSATAAGQVPAQVTGGKARKTGMLLARAKLGTAHKRGCRDTGSPKHAAVKGTLL